MLLKYLPYLKNITSSQYSYKFLTLQNVIHNNNSYISVNIKPNLYSASRHNFSTYITRNIPKSTSYTPVFLSNSSLCTFSNVLNNKHSDKDLEIISLKFPNPKGVLHNFYSVVSNELKTPYQLNSHFKCSPQRKGKKYQEWTCTYSIKWPEEHKLSATAISKAEASKKAASKVLYLLDKAGKITDNGQPLIYNKEEVNKITKQNYVPIILDSAVEIKLKEICDIYENKLKAQIESSSYEKTKEEEINNNDIEDNVINSWSIIQQRNKQISTYFAKESVDLPIQAHKKELENLLDHNRVIIIRGEPGCGKSTRVPQYLLEHWVTNKGLEPVRIIVTQPRRLAAISLAERVANERQEHVGNVIGYQVRLKSKFNPQTGRILYCTTGILLRQLQSDSALENCTHVIIDEAHERDVNTDLLMNLLRHALEVNPNLKIIVMSATIDSKLFQEYFNNAPVMNIAGLTYPVKMNFLDDINLNLYKTRNLSENTTPLIIYEEIAKLINWIHKTKPEGAILCFLPGWDEISRVRTSLERILDRYTTSVLALHSKLSDNDQRKIFGHPPVGVRKIILATNIAETSVTIDDIVYVVDSGVHKEKRYDAEKGITYLGNHWISRSSTNQRKGRAGRVQPGESFHLFPKKKYETMAEFSIPEILRVSLDKIVLDAKVYSHNMDAIEFFSKLPCPPDDITVLKAVNELTNLELLDENENVTSLGKAISEFQLPPKLSKAMVQSVIYKCVTPITDIATIFSSESEIFSTSLIDKPAIKKIKERMSPTSDHIALMLIFEQWLKHITDEEFQEASMFCERNNIVPYKLNTMKKLEEIHFEYLEKYLKNIMDLSDKLAENDEIVKGVLLSGVGNVLMNRKWDIVKGRLKSADTFITKTNHKATITPESVNNKKTKYKSPFFIYINETKSLIRRTMLVRETSLINPLTLMLFKNDELVIKKILDERNDRFENGLILQFRGTKLKFLCSERQANVILTCKEVMKTIEKYFIYQLTEGGVKNKEVLQNWDVILDIINEILKSEAEKSSR